MVALGLILGGIGGGFWLPAVFDKRRELALREACIRLGLDANGMGTVEGVPVQLFKVVDAHLKGSASLLRAVDLCVGR